MVSVYILIAFSTVFQCRQHTIVNLTARYSKYGKEKKELRYMRTYTWPIFSRSRSISASLNIFASVQTVFVAHDLRRHGLCLVSTSVKSGPESHVPVILTDARETNTRLGIARPDRGKQACANGQLTNENHELLHEFRRIIENDTK